MSDIIIEDGLYLGLENICLRVRNTIVAGYSNGWAAEFYELAGETQDDTISVKTYFSEYIRYLIESDFDSQEVEAIELLFKLHCISSPLKLEVLKDKLLDPPKDYLENGHYTEDFIELIKGDMRYDILIDKMVEEASDILLKDDDILSAFSLNLELCR